MSAYAVFTAKRGRPKLDKTTQSNYVNKAITRTSDENVVSSLFYLRKISEEQLLSIEFYEKLYHNYIKSIEAPNMQTTSVAKIHDRHCETRMSSSIKDESVLHNWLNVRNRLSEVSNDCEEIMNKVIVENKMKYELLNPISIGKNLLGIFKAGVDKITEYRSRSRIRTKAY